MQIQIRSHGKETQQANYRRSIERVLNDIRSTKVGKIVIRHIEMANHPIIIFPYMRSGGNGAFAMAMHWSSAGSFTADRIASGTGVRISFSVERSTFVNGNTTEVLLHELCHGLRCIKGLYRLARYDGEIQALRIASFDNVEEFFTITTTSVLSSELGRPLRGNHGRWPLRDTSIYEVPPFSTRFRQICERMPSFTKDMASIPETVAPFNPYRDFIINSQVNNIGIPFLRPNL